MLLALALAIRIAEVQVTPYKPVFDAGSYLKLAGQVAQTGDESTGHAPGVGAGGTRGPSAYFPPGYPYFLGAVDVLDGHSGRQAGAVHLARLSQALLGTVTVALIGLVAFEAFGELAGLLALGVGAAYPVLVEQSGTLVAENLLTPLILAAVWTALRAARSTRPDRWIAATGALAGLSILTHVNAAVLLVPLGVAAWRARPGARAPALLAGVAILTLVPWTIRNLVVMHQFIPISDESGITLVGTYNRASAANPTVPYKWRIYYAIPGERRLIRASSHLSEPALSSRLEAQAFHYIADHPFAPLAVVYHNTVRLLELEGWFAARAGYDAIGLPTNRARLGVIGFWVLLAIALAGALTGKARNVARWFWVVPLLLWLSVAAVNTETPRFRQPIDVFLILLAACALSAAAEALRRRRLGGAPVRSHAGTLEATRPRQLVEVVERLA